MNYSSYYQKNRENKRVLHMLYSLYFHTVYEHSDYHSLDINEIVLMIILFPDP